MTIQDRKEREKEEMRELILNAASKILTEEGIEKLSIRKIADRIEYSPALIYHYFADKDELITHLMKRGYQKIIDALSGVRVPDNRPDIRLKELARSYINAALQIPDEFLAVQLSSAPSVLEYTSYMFKGAMNQKPALKIMADCVKEIYKDKNLDESFIELTAQIIATSSLGLIIKLIVDKEIDEEQRENLIEHYIKCTVDAMVLGKPLQSI